MGILLDENNDPEGGKWSFDEANRLKLPKNVAVPELGRASESESLDYDREIALAADDLQSRGFPTWGSVEDFIYPIDHEGSRRWLRRFLEERFESFGNYEDALSTRGQFLYHSVLTPMLNIGLLNPFEVVSQALEFAETQRVELNNVEGFVRQIIGWREYMKLMYEREGMRLRNGNFWEFYDEVPQGLYDGTTGLLPVDLAVERLRKHGYVHHIDRLMVLGSFFLMLRVRPNEVYRWFMDAFVDAYDWVMVPNVYGMSQFSDGGSLVTKPYLSGSNYLRKMSDYPKGPWCDAWDSLFWTFIADHEAFFAKQYRMRMMLSHLNKMSSEQRSIHESRAMDVRETLKMGKTWGAELV